ncbi:hypothetical protein ALCH109712_00755 [Alkalicoccus chagannorensis]
MRSTCPECNSHLYSHRWQTISTERDGSGTLYIYRAVRCSSSTCSFHETALEKEQRWESQSTAH